MSNQWQYFLKNLGEWQGSFTRFSPAGKEREDIPTIVSFEAKDNNTRVHQIVRRLPPNKPPEEKHWEYTSLNRSILFFENGAFSQGSIQWSPVTEFGAELGLIAGDRRLRLVQLFNKEGKLEQLTLIREKLAGTDAPERPSLAIAQLVGEWQGKATTIYPDFRPPRVATSEIKIAYIDDKHIIQELTFNQDNNSHTITSQARIEGSILYFEDKKPPKQILLLPDGASCLCPLYITPRNSFFLEAGWLINPQERQRLIRHYGEKGEWTSLTLTEERKIK